MEMISCVSPSMGCCCDNPRVANVGVVATPNVLSGKLNVATKVADRTHESGGTRKRRAQIESLKSADHFYPNSKIDSL